MTPEQKAERQVIRHKYGSVRTDYVQKMHGLWERGTLSKKDIELKFFGDARSNGKRFTKLVWEHLHIDIEEKSVLMKKYEALEERVAELERRLNG